MFGTTAGSGDHRSPRFGIALLGVFGATVAKVENRRREHFTNTMVMDVVQQQLLVP